MPTKKILKLGNKKLSTPSELIDLTLAYNDKSFRQIITDMQQTMIAHKGVGIAAPQIGINKRIIMFGFDKNERYPNEQAIPFTVLINPNFRVLSEKLSDGWEGCLSVPGLRGIVQRFEKIEYSGYDRLGNFIKRTAEGFHARIIQHECDHLNGILFPQRLKNINDFGFEDELNNF